MKVECSRCYEQYESESEAEFLRHVRCRKKPSRIEELEAKVEELTETESMKVRELEAENKKLKEFFITDKFMRKYMLEKYNYGCVDMEQKER